MRIDDYMQLKFKKGPVRLSSMSCYQDVRRKWVEIQIREVIGPPWEIGDHGGGIVLGECVHKNPNLGIEGESKGYHICEDCKKDYHREMQEQKKDYKKWSGKWDPLYKEAHEYFKKLFDLLIKDYEERLYED